MVSLSHTHTHTHTHTQHTHTPYFSHYHICLLDEAIEVLRGVADSIRQKHDKLAARHGSGEWVVSSWGILFLFSFIVSVVLSSMTVHGFLAGYYLHVLTTGITALVAAGSMVYVFATFSDVYISRSLAENLSEIEAIIQYHRPNSTQRASTRQ